MDDQDLSQKLVELRQQINLHNYRYHVLDSPLISDDEFDQLMVQLRQIEAEYPEWITPDSPTQRAGAALIEKFTKVKHPAPVLSLANAFNAGDVRAWYERINRIDDRVPRTDYVIEPKIDGLTVILHYHNGLLVQGATRGMVKSAKILPPTCAPSAPSRYASPLIRLFHRRLPTW